MLTTRSLFAFMLSCVLVVLVLPCAPAVAQDASNWWLFVGVAGHGSVLGSTIGVHPGASDGYDGDQTVPLGSASVGIYLLCYRTEASGWPDGLYSGDIYGTPIPAGGSRSWSGFYLWAQNFTPTTANIIGVHPEFSLAPPTGYRAHLVLDYIPASCGWTGPMDIWINDLSINNTFALPIPVVTDPLQGTQFHIDVYAPAVPEPSSLAALLCGLVGASGAVVRRRRHR